MLFSEVIGQESVKAQLKQMASGGRLPHALLFLGPQGSGKLSLAMALAQYLLCENPGADDACGQCNQCNKAGKLIHPDLHFSYPTIGTKAISDHFLVNWRQAMADNPYLDVNQWLQGIGAENKQGNITKEECVNIIKKLSLKTFENNYKVLIMWLPEFLGKEGNRLLKVIEEPPESTIFILVAEDQELILNTILSRCQIVNIKALSDEEVTEGLVQQQGLSREEALSVAYLSNGNFNEALQLAGQRGDNHSALFLEWMRSCYRGNPADMVKWVEGFAKLGRENQKHFLRYALHFLREFTLLKLSNGQARARLQEQELQTAQNMTAVLELEQVEQLGKLFSDCSYAVERNANPKILFLDASIQMHKIMKGKLREAYTGLKAANVL
ncbi:MAG: ATP-binding protein [Phaeodactylibacter sp.]|nr:ATP-binding protein [Phaeodactylibacter sp.]MCB9054109.1 ATP-binding protein [Lewinellaceae bacterium]